MSIKVLVVDDSSFFRRRVSEIINQDPMLEVIDTAKNGREAVEMAQRLKPDVITMDIEMPVLDGISAVREIMASSPTPILMFSSLTHQGATATLEALEAGALDFLPKKFEDIARDKEEAIKTLQQRVKAIARRSVFSPRAATATNLRSSLSSATPTPTSHSARPASSISMNKPEPSARVSPLARSVAPIAETRSTPVSFKRTGKSYDILTIGTSTGGPVALQTVLTALPANFPLPILLIQHMPATFTAAFAARLNSLCQIKVKEAQDGDAIVKGQAYLAPGGKQMLVEGRGASARIRIIDGNDKVNYKPCVDITFASLAKLYQSKVLAIVLTGMGADGRDGGRMLKNVGATIWAQDEKSCVVYGMPQAVAKEGISSESLPLDKVAQRIMTEFA